MKYIPIKELWQWDVGDRLEVPYAELYTQFYTKGVEGCIEIAPTDYITEGDKTYVVIPPECTQNGNKIIVFAYERDGDILHTESKTMLYVSARVKPSDYAYEPSEIKTFDRLAEQIRLQVMALAEMDANAVEGDEAGVTLTEVDGHKHFDFTLPKGATGNGIASVEYISSEGLIDTYKILFTDGTFTTVEVTNGNGIASFVLKETVDNVRTYRMTFTDNTYVDIDIEDGSDYVITEQDKHDIADEVEGNYVERLIAVEGDVDDVKENISNLDESKANIDGYYDTLSVGLSDNLIDRKGIGNEQMFTFRTSCGDDSIADDGNGIIQSIKGRTLVWNQLVENGNFADGEADWRKPSSDDFSWSFGDGEVEAVSLGGGSHLNVSQTDFSPLKEGHKYFVSAEYFTDTPVQVYTYAGSFSMRQTVEANQWERHTAIFTQGSVSLTRFIAMYVHNSTVVTGATYKGRNVILIDLTQMFGAGNEPSTVEEFRAMFPNDYYPYNAGELISLNATGLKTVGFNQMNSEGKVKVVEGFEYEVVGSKTGLTYSDGTAITLTSDKFRANRIDTVTVDGYDSTTCVHLTWSGYRNGEYEPYWSNTLPLPISTYFADGMKSVGNVYDELAKDKAIVRIGSRAYQSGDEDDTTVITDGTTTYYVLAEEVVTPINPPLDLTYKVADFGTEEVLYPSGNEVDVPLKAVIKYSDDYTRMLATLPKQYDTTDGLDGLLSALATMLGSALDGTVTITRGAYDSSTKKYAWTCEFTPSV